MKSKAIVSNPAPILCKHHYFIMDCCVLVCNCLVMITEHRSGVHAIILRGVQQPLKH